MTERLINKYAQTLKGANFFVSKNPYNNADNENIWFGKIVDKFVVFNRKPHF